MKKKKKVVHRWVNQYKAIPYVLEGYQYHGNPFQSWDERGMSMFVVTKKQWDKRCKKIRITVEEL